MSFHHRLHGKNLHKKDVVFHYMSEGKPLNNQDQGMLKLVFVMDNKTDELMGVKMEGAQEDWRLAQHFLSLFVKYAWTVPEQQNT